MLVGGPPVVIAIEEVSSHFVALGHSRWSRAGKKEFGAAALWRNLWVAAGMGVPSVANVAGADAAVPHHRAAGVETTLGHTAWVVWADEASGVVVHPLPSGPFHIGVLP